MKRNMIVALCLSVVLGACELENTGNPQTDFSEQHVLNTPTFLDLVSVTDALVSRFTELNTPNTSLEDKLIELESIAKNNTSFTALVSTTFVAPTATDVEVFLVDYESAYNTLQVSTKMRYYLDTLLEETRNSYEALEQLIIQNTELTTTEKDQLYFIVKIFQAHAPSSGGGVTGDDPSWDVRNIVAVVSGYSQSAAHAVFHVALLRVSP